MEHYALRFLACRAVASLSGPTEWLTLKVAISMITPLDLCACIIEPFPELSSIAPMERYVLGFWLAGRGTLHHGHGNTDQHQRVLESGKWGALTFCPCLDISSIAPMKRYALGFICLQGGGLYIEGTATLTNTNVYSNQANGVCSPSSLA